MNNQSHQLYLNFYGFPVFIESCNEQILTLIEKDFFIFKGPPIANHLKDSFTLKIIDKNAPENLIPEIQSTMQTQTSLSYDLNGIRYNDYYGELTSKINFDKNEATLYSSNIKKLHEVSYLIILSRVGKKLDLMGFHKLHAFAIAMDDIAVVCMMPTKGGKSTLLLELLKDPRIKMISDDIPLINRHGNVFSFPIKIGLESYNNEIPVENPQENIYQMHRTQYGTKTLISVRGLKNKIIFPNQSFKKVILIEAFRINSSHSYLGLLSWKQTFRGLFKHGVIGIGLPMVLEYFWESGFKDFLVKTFIFFSRSISFFIFSLKATRLRLRLGKKPEKAAVEIIYFLEKFSKK